MDEDQFSDADLWEHLVRQGVPKPEATARVRARQAGASGFGGAGEGRSWDAPKTNPLLGAVRAFNQGATLGFSDEAEGILGGAAALVPGGRSPHEGYTQARDESREGLNAFRRDHPAVAPAIELGAGFATGGLLEKGAAKLTGAAVGRASNPLIQRTVAAVQRAGAQPVVQGAATGAVAGAGAAEGGLMDRATGAATGGALGGALGGLLQAVGAVRGPAARAKGQVVGTLERGGTDIRTAAANARPGEMLLDVGGPQVLKKARALESIPGAGSDRVRADVLRRDAELPGRVTEALQREMGVPFENGVETLAELAAQKKSNATPLYEAAFEHGVVEDPALVTLFQKKPSLQAAYRKAQETAAEEGTPLAPLDALDVRTIHMVKEELDDLIRRARRSADQSAPSARNTRAMVQTKGELLGALESAVPAYGQARAQFAGDSAVEDAFEAALAGDRDLGLRKFTTEDPNRIAHALKKMGPSEQEFYRRGAMDALRQELASTADGRDLTRVIDGDEEMRNRIHLLFGNDNAAYDRFVEEMGSLRTMKGNTNFVLGGSPTSRIDAERADLVGQPFKLSDVLHPFRTGEKAIDKGVARVQAGGTAATLDRMAPMLTARDAELQELTRILEEFGKKEQARRLLTSRAARGLGVPVGLASGRDAP